MSYYRFMPHGVSFAVRLKGMILHPLPLPLTTDRNSLDQMNIKKEDSIDWCDGMTN